MNYLAYKQLFIDILSTAEPFAPYDDAMYLNYTKLNASRMNRWEKQMQLDVSLVNAIKGIRNPQHWLIITEPWCGDAAHIIPFLVRLSELNDLITCDLELRDTEPFSIEGYKTKGTKSIPILVVRDVDGRDLHTWGPRPQEAQNIVDDLKALDSDFETVKVALQNWYNNDKGKSLCAELFTYFKQFSDQVI